MTTPLITKTTTIEELAALVCNRLADAGISVVLTGGAVVSIYSDNEYLSYDLDFIVIGLGKKVDSVMTDLA
jgi:predicted nucleotidyltransferase